METPRQGKTVKRKSIHNDLIMTKMELIAPGVAVPPWATETVLSLWLAADEDRVSHVLSHVVW